MERAVPVDYVHAKDIDVECLNCRAGRTDNARQLDLLSNRVQSHPQEKPVIDSFITRCKDCFKDGRPYIKSLEGGYSCLYRGK